MNETQAQRPGPITIHQIHHQKISRFFKLSSLLSTLGGLRRVLSMCEMAQENQQPKKQPKSFEALTPELSSWILDYTRSMNFARTTPVQGMAIPLLMGNKDLVVEVSNSIFLYL